MRILLIIPITGLDEGAIEERLEYLRSIARPGTSLDYVQIEEGPPAIESAVDHAIASAEVLKHVEEAEASGFDAIIVWCGGDPGVEEAMTLVDIPVIGPGESMRAISSLMGRNVGQVTAPLPVLDLRKDLEKTYQLTRSAIEGLIEEGYDSFCLGCLGMWGMGGPLREELGLPVIDGAEASLKMAELAVELGLRPSRIAYPRHPPLHGTPGDA